MLFFFVCSAIETDRDSIKKEDLTPDIPNFAQYLIIGGGTTAMSAFKTIRAHDAQAKVRGGLVIYWVFCTFLYLGSCN